MKILILGGNGFIGKQLAKFLADQNERVISFDLRIPKIKEEGIQYVSGDFFDWVDLKKKLNGVNVVVHAISCLNPGNSNNLYMMGYEKELVQSIKLCDYLNESKIKMIFLSSGGTVYGNHLKQPIAEKFATNPINHYGCIKRCIETAMEVFSVQSGTPMYIARIANPYGIGQDYRKGVGFIDAVIRHALHNETIEVWGDGSIIRDYIYITDVCKMIYSICLYDGTEKIFNVSSGNGVSQKQIIDIVKHMIGNLQVVYKEQRSVDLKKVVLDNSKIKKLCNFELISLQEGIRLYIKYIKNNEMD